MTDYSSLIRDDTARLKAWLFDHALPLWFERGIDPVNGGFAERLAIDGSPLEEARRARVQPRQIYCFIEGGRLGWRGPWRDAAIAGMENFIKRYCLENGAVAALVEPGGVVLDQTFDLYNQAFALLAFAQVAAVDDDLADAMRARADKLLDYLKQTYSHPEGGFEEARPRSLPLRSNPHMHLFEACLAWELLDNSGRWAQMSDEIANLCLTRFIDGDTGGLREFFDGAWMPMPGEQGRIMEPGHQFEWAWLLMRWGRSRGDARAIGKAGRLFEFGCRYGMDDARGVAVMSLYDDFTVHDPVARLWPQTEWIKAAIAMAEGAVGDKRHLHEEQIHKGVLALETFLAVPVQGLWRDKQKPDGSFVEEPVPASTFYHIVCALSELCRYQEKRAG